MAFYAVHGVSICSPTIMESLLITTPVRNQKSSPLKQSGTLLAGGAGYPGGTAFPFRSLSRPRHYPAEAGPGGLCKDLLSGTSPRSRHWIFSLNPEISISISMTGKTLRIRERAPQANKPTIPLLCEMARAVERPTSWYTRGGKQRPVERSLQTKSYHEPDISQSLVFRNVPLEAGHIRHSSQTGGHTWALVPRPLSPNFGGYQPPTNRPCRTFHVLSPEWLRACSVHQAACTECSGQESTDRREPH